MIIIHSARRAGKTTRLIEISAEKGYHIVTHSIKMTEIILKQAEKMRLLIPSPLTYQHLENQNFRDMEIKGLLIDDLEYFLHKITGGHIKYATLTAEIRGIDETKYMDTL